MTWHPARRLPDTAPRRARDLAFSFHPLPGTQAGDRALFKVGPAIGQAQGGRAFYISPLGNDAADGCSRETAFRTVTRGAQALREGGADWLVLMPGIHDSGLDALTEGS